MDFKETNKLSILIDINNYVYASADVFEYEDGTLYNPLIDGIIIDKDIIPDGLELRDCKYENDEIIYSEERVEWNLLQDLRSERTELLSKYDKYQLPYLQGILTDEQKNEYNQWRQQWLDVTETKIKPVLPHWFD